MESGPVTRAITTVTDCMAAERVETDHYLRAVLESLSGGHTQRARLELAGWIARLQRRFRLEEEVVFPLFEARLGLSSGPTAVLRDEHDELERTLRELSDLGPENDRGQLQRLGQTVAEHCLREERVIFPILDRQLQDSERARVVGRLCRS